jgi:LPXTG-motif cell wall-anchored protein
VYAANVTLKAGTYRMRAVATDAAGNTATSREATLTVDAPPPPTTLATPVVAVVLLAVLLAALLLLLLLRRRKKDPNGQIAEPVLPRGE